MQSDVETQPADTETNQSDVETQLQPADTEMRKPPTNPSDAETDDIIPKHKRNEEDRVAYACDSSSNNLTDKQIDEKRLPKKPLVPLGRHDTECNTWLNMKLYDIQSHVRQRSQ